MWMTGKHWWKAVHPAENASGRDVAVSNKSGWSTGAELKHALRKQDDIAAPPAELAEV